MNQDLAKLLEAESRYLLDAGWRLSHELTHKRTPNAPALMQVWVSPHNGDEYAQPAAVRAQKIQDGYLPRPDSQHQPASPL